MVVFTSKTFEKINPPSRMCCAEQPASTPDPTREGYWTPLDSSCADCGARTWCVRNLFGDGWYVSRWCHSCVESSGRAESVSALNARTQKNLEQRYINAGLTRVDLELCRQVRPDPRLQALRAGEARWCGYLVGRPGTGKSTVALSTVQDFVSRGYRCKYFVESGLYDLLRPNGGLHIDAIERLDLLVIDEFGSDTRTEWEAKTMRSIVNLRYRSRAPTIFVSNHSLRTINRIEGLGEMVTTRIFEGLGGKEWIRADESSYIEYSWCYRTGMKTRLPDGCLG